MSADNAADRTAPAEPVTAPDAAAPDAAAARPFAAGYFHGTKAALVAGDRIAPGYAPNFGPRPHAAGWVYCSATLDAAIWGAELARGDAPETGAAERGVAEGGRPGRVYVVEPTGALEDDPELTDARFPGNPSRSYRSRAPLRVVGEVVGWRGHAPEALRAMRDGIARQEQRGDEPINI